MGATASRTAWNRPGSGEICVASSVECRTALLQVLDPPYSDVGPRRERVRVVAKAREVFRFDRAELSYGFAAAGSVVIAVLLVVLYVWGGGTGSGVFGFILTALAFASAPSLSWQRAVAFGVVGGLLTFLAFAAAGNAGWSAAVLGVVATVAALATAHRTRAAVNWSYLAIWTLIALLIAEEGAGFEAALSFAVGSALATGLVALLRRSTIDDVTARGGVKSSPATASWFAIGKGMAVALGVVIGFVWFPQVPYWVALTVLIVAQPEDRATTRLAFARSLGTLLGVAAGGLIISVTGGGDVWSAVALVGLVFCQMLFLKGNYVLYATFLTAVLIVAASFTISDVGGVGWARIIATVLGAVLALAVTEITFRLSPAPGGDT